MLLGWNILRTKHIDVVVERIYFQDCLWNIMYARMKRIMYQLEFA